MTNPDDLFLAEWHAERDKTGGEYTEPGDELWTARPVLAHVREFAQACRASPWATLGVVLARVIAATPPFVVLPRLVGKQGSLNMFVGIVGEPGRGKGTADGAAADALELPGEIPEINPGSGEGLAHMFGRRKPGGEIEPVYESVLMTVAEIGTLAALGARSGSTLLPELRKAWMGESLGFWNANPAKRIGDSRRTRTGAACPPVSSRNGHRSCSTTPRAGYRNGSSGCPRSTRTRRSPSPTSLTRGRGSCRPGR
jgi:hypothetical protein